MKNFYNNLNLTVLISAYFSDPEKRMILEEGMTIMHQGEENERLFLVLSGSFAGYVDNPEGDAIPFFQLQPGMFAGVQSFFSRTYISSTTIIAQERSEVAYIEREQQTIANEGNESLLEQFMPVVVADLAYRQQLAHTASVDKAQTLKKLIASEKMASLGQMAAGIAHELNNAVAVLQTNTRWLAEQLPILIPALKGDAKTLFLRGLNDGRKMSTSEIRKRRKALQDRWGLSASICDKIAETGLSDEDLPNSPEAIAALIDRLGGFWEIGATLNGMQLAADHAAHVAKSVKTLGAHHSTRHPDVDVNDSLREAITLLRSPLRKVTVASELNPVSGITANKGELVQIWVNLIRNACESLQQEKTAAATIGIRSREEKGAIIVEISDNGPGIPAETLPKIFHPDFTTKVSGLSFGLGLGLSIVQRLVESYQGNVQVESNREKTVFIVQLPLA